MAEVAGTETFTLSPAAADELAARLLGDLRTKLGGLHIAHARRVAAAVGGDDLAVAVGLLHDVVEKAGTTLDELLDLVGDERLVALVDMLTRRDQENEEEYLSRCLVDPIALVVKRADLTDKLTAPDSEVDHRTVLELRRQARERLALLDLLAHAGPASAVMPAGRTIRPDEVPMDQPRAQNIDLLVAHRSDAVEVWNRAHIIDPRTQVDEVISLVTSGRMTVEEFDRQRRLIADG
jgi:hypothetical protein